MQSKILSGGRWIKYMLSSTTLTTVGENDYGVVKKDIFAQTYEKM